MQIQSIWIEDEVSLDAENQNHDPANTNSDVIVTLTDSSRWIASFFTYANVASLVERYQTTGECLNGRFFWSSDMILVDLVTRERVEEVVSHLIDANRFTYIFSRRADNTNLDVL